MKVLVADDSAVVRERLVSMLAEVRDAELAKEAENAGEALHLIRRNQPDVVTLDLRMPGGGGLGLLRKLGKSGRMPVTVVLTNYPDPHYRKKCLEAGGQVFLGQVNRVLQDS